MAKDSLKIRLGYLLLTRGIPGNYTFYFDKTRHYWMIKGMGIAPQKVAPNRDMLFYYIGNGFLDHLKENPK